MVRKLSVAELASYWHLRRSQLVTDDLHPVSQSRTHKPVARATLRTWTDDSLCDNHRRDRARRNGRFHRDT